MRSSDPATLITGNKYVAKENYDPKDHPVFVVR